MQLSFDGQLVGSSDLANAIYGVYNSSTLAKLALQRLPSFAPTYTVVDAFCGCGGLSVGLEMTRRFVALMGFDIKPEAVETFTYNHEKLSGIKPVGLTADIQTLGSARIRKAIAKAFGSTNPNIDVLVGGPPCEGFSQNRVDQKTGNRAHKWLDDPRNQLFQWFVELAHELQPRVVIIENVPDLIRHRDGATRDEVIAALDQAGFVATARVLNAASYGVPQMRRRAIFLAQRKSDLQRTGVHLKFPVPTHQPYPLMHPSLNDDAAWLPGDSGYWVTVREAIGDLPAPTEIEANGKRVEVPEPSAELTRFRALMRSVPGALTHHIARKLGPGGLKRVRALKQGQLCADLPASLRPKSYYHYSYSRLSWAQPARTITKFAYHVGSGQFAHPVQDRSITMREALRLQSFPDAFELRGTDQIRSLSALVGSAVPPVLANAVGREVAHYIDAITAKELPLDQASALTPIHGDAVVRRLESSEWSRKPVAQIELLDHS
jgi:DNA (cytosine-5)-methyltransferase 1